MAQPSTGKPSVTAFQGKRVVYDTPSSLEEVLHRLGQKVGALTNMSELADRARSAAEYEALVNARLGESGFVLMMRVDHSRWITKYGIQHRLMRWILGNPLIALTMIRHDLTAGLFAPVELPVTEAEAGGSTITFVLPSSLIVVSEHPELRSAAEALDAKLDTLVASVAGVSA